MKGRTQAQCGAACSAKSGGTFPGPAFLDTRYQLYRELEVLLYKLLVDLLCGKYSQWHACLFCDSCSGPLTPVKNSGCHSLRAVSLKMHCCLSGSSTMQMRLQP